MKNLFINIFLIFFGLSFNYAQDGVGINIESPKAILDIQSNDNTNSGILFPLIGKFSSINPSEDQNAMLVFLDKDLLDSPGFEGLYFWDNENELWQYIFQSKMLGLNLFKTIINSDTGFPSIAGINSNTNVWFKTNFETIESPDANTKLENGNLIISKTGFYSVFFTGAVYKTKDDTSATPTEVGIFIDSDVTPILSSLAPLPAADNGNRSVNHTISSMIYLEKGQAISVKTKRTTNMTTVMGPASSYSLTLSFLD